MPIVQRRWRQSGGVRWRLVWLLHGPRHHRPATLATATLTDWSHRNHQSAINVIIIIFHTRSGPGNVKTSDNMRALVPVLDIA